VSKGGDRDGLILTVYAWSFDEVSCVRIPPASIRIIKRKGALIMHRTLILTLMVFITASWLQAQEGDPGRDVWVPTNTYPPTIDGCLRNSSLHYTVVGSDGTVYNLTGNTARLSHYVGHEVEITGKPTVRSLSTTMKNAASTVEELPALDVQSATELSKTCKPTK
jgi:hypothetical protein